MLIQLENHVITTLAAPISGVVTSLDVSTGDGTLFPVLNAGEYFYITLMSTDLQRIEICKCTARTGDTLTIERGSDDSTAQPFALGDEVTLRHNKAVLLDLTDEMKNRAGYNNSGGALAAFKVVKATGHYIAGDLPEIDAISDVNADQPIGILRVGVADATLTKIVAYGILTCTGFDTTGATLEDKVYCDASGDLTLSETALEIGRVLTLNANGVVLFNIGGASGSTLPLGDDGTLAYFDTTQNKYLSTTQEGAQYNSTLECLESEIITRGTQWDFHGMANANDHYGVCYGNGLYVAVASEGTGNRVQTSPDGKHWTAQVSAADNAWSAVAYGNGIFAAIHSAGGADTQGVMTSPDGITWTLRTTPAQNRWTDIVFGNGVFVAVAFSGTGTRVMTSPNGITWTAQTPASADQWRGVTYGSGVFVAVSSSGTGTRVMTSPDGVTWTTRTSAADNSWYCCGYGDGTFVALSADGTDRCMYSTDLGVSWAVATMPGAHTWRSVAYGDGVFAAVSSFGGGVDIAISNDGINWTAPATPSANLWSVTYGNGRFVAVVGNGVGSYTSGRMWLTESQREAAGVGGGASGTAVGTPLRSVYEVTVVDTATAIYTATGDVGNIKVNICNRNNVVVNVHLAHLDGNIGTLVDEDYLLYNTALQPYETKSIELDGMVNTDTLVGLADTTDVNFVMTAQTDLATGTRLAATTVAADTDTALVVATAAIVDGKVVICNKNGFIPSIYRVAVVDGAIGTLADEDYIVYNDIILENETKILDVDVDLTGTYTVVVRSDSADVHFLFYGKEV